MHGQMPANFWLFMRSIAECAVVRQWARLFGLLRCTDSYPSFVRSPLCASALREYFYKRRCDGGAADMGVRHQYCRRYVFITFCSNNKFKLKRTPKPVTSVGMCASPPL